MSRAQSLTERLDALAEALRAAGVPPDRIATILGSGATATMNALMLDAVLDENLHVAPRAGAAPVPAAPEQPLRVAA